MYVQCAENEGSGGPTVIIFHETVHTDPLEDPTEILNQRLGSLNQVFSCCGPRGSKSLEHVASTYLEIGKILKQ